MAENVPAGAAHRIGCHSPRLGVPRTTLANTLRELHNQVPFVGRGGARPGPAGPLQRRVIAPADRRLLPIPVRNASATDFA